MLIDLSHTIADGTITYPGLPAPKITDFWNRQRGFHIARIDMVANTGTYVDAPFHRYAEGADIASLPLERLVDLAGVIVDGEIGDVGGQAVLFRTGWSKHFGTEKYRSGGHPFLTREIAEKLVSASPALVGIDSMNIDDTSGEARPVHSILLAAGIPIVEHLTNLDRLPRTGFRFFAPPAKFAGVGTFTVRAFALT